ncbi:hypothetical protein Droror1_Dr00007682 [Drosera rotundifolia]
MSARDQAVAALIRQAALAGDGAVLGVALAYVAVRTFIRFASTSYAARLIRAAPSIAVSDLRSLLSGSDGDGDGDGGAAAKLVVVRGAVEAKSAVDGSWKNLWPDVLGSKESSAKGVVIQRTQSCIYNEWRGLFGWTPDLRGVLARSFKEQESSSTRVVPFILTDSNSEHPLLEYVVVNLDGSRHPMPLTTVYHHMQPISASPYTVLQALFGHDYPIGLLDEEKILPLGKEVTAVGFCYTKNGILEIKSSRDLPYFLSELTQDQMVIELSYKTKILLWSGLIFGSLAVCVLGFSVMRNWSKWKAWRARRTSRQRRDDAQLIREEEDEDSGEVPDGQLCVICLMRRRRAAFVPCGHLVCCHRCALSVEGDRTPKCPVCRQVISGSVRVYDS